MKSNDIELKHMIPVIYRKDEIQALLDKLRTKYNFMESFLVFKLREKTEIGFYIHIQESGYRIQGLKSAACSVSIKNELWLVEFDEFFQITIFEITRECWQDLGDIFRDFKKNTKFIEVKKNLSLQGEFDLYDNWYEEHKKRFNDRVRRAEEKAQQPNAYFPIVVTD